MNQKRILNILLSVVAVLLLVNLGVTLFPVAQAVPKTQYKTVWPPVNPSSAPKVIEDVLNQQSADGWQYVGEDGQVLIFKK